ncbi:MAG: succinate dehydrogenase, cytochrome b556 subunit [Micavibrio sp.]|nr:succinate dehydrogenase, cytochrome b556 subunit [Micavibrio sp.]|tara:strand:- start:19 stop:471 length:453 start_codon:yes stop_codon:yes gene_type:complete
MTDPDTQSKRPLSPHLQVYRLPYNALMSIAGRMVGIGLAGTMVLTCVWFIAVAFSEDIYNQTQEWLAMPILKYLFLVWSFAIFFYLGNGLRHFLWTVGIGLNEKKGIMSGNIVLILSLLFTLGLWHVTINEGSLSLNLDKSVLSQEATNE